MDASLSSSVIVSTLVVVILILIIFTTYWFYREFKKRKTKLPDTQKDEKESEGKKSKGLQKDIEDSKYFIILLATISVGLGFSIYWTVTNEYVPVNKNIIFYNGTDLDVIVTSENYTKVPLLSFFYPKVANVTIEVYYKTLPIFLKRINLSSNGSSILTTKNETFEVVGKGIAHSDNVVPSEHLPNSTLSSSLSDTNNTVPEPVSKFVNNTVNVPVRKVTASLFQSTNRPENTIDNLLDTRWAAPGDPQSITFEFEKNYSVSQIGIAFFKGLDRSASFEINGQIFNSSGRTIKLENFTLNPPIINTNSLKIIGHGSGGPWNSYSEVKIYGAPTTALPNQNSFATKNLNATTPKNTPVAASKYTVQLNMGHPLVVGNYTDQYTINLFYRKIQDSGNMLVEKIPFHWNIQSLDWSILSYFWIIFFGVLLSRVFTFKGKYGFKFEPLELIWVPFSGIITLLVYTSFVDQLFQSLTQNILANLSLTFAFGFGFDKILEVWQKSPGLERDKSNSE